jgi:hypothetical protein
MIISTFNIYESNLEDFKKYFKYEKNLEKLKAVFELLTDTGKAKYIKNKIKKYDKVCKKKL